MIFLDNASTTRLKKEALDAMMPFLTEDYANPSSVHKMARGPRNAVDEARKSIANAINAQKGEIYFTSGGTESDNWVIKNAPKILSDKGKHIIVSSIEHHAIIESANNEIGTIEPIAEIGAFAREKGIIFHTDAVQAVGHIPMDVQAMNIDMLSVSGHKFGGPKGIGFLYVRKGLDLPSFMNGGSQENGMRAGTTNVPGIIGMAKALEVSIAEMDSASEKMISMRDHCIERIENEIPGCRLNGDRKRRLPGNVNFTFMGIGEGSCGLPMLMNFNDICVSTGSACAASSSEPSHVLLAIGVPREDANGSIRITLSEDNTMEEIDRTVDVLKESIDRLRRLGM